MIKALVLALSHRDSSLRLWDTSSGKLLRAFPQIRGLFVRRFVRPLAFSPDSRLLALYPISTTSLTEPRTILVWDTTSGEVRARLPWPEDTSPARLLFTADGKRAIASFHPGWLARDRIGVCVWDVVSGRELLRIRGSTRAIALSPDEKTLATAGHSTIHLWELASGQERARYTGHRHDVLTLTFTPNGRLLASGSGDYTALVWDVTGRSPDGTWSLYDVRPDTIEHLWTELGGGDGRRAYRAHWALAAARQTVPFLARRLRPVPRVEEDRLRRLIAGLDSDTFAVREAASQELRQLGELAEPALRQTLSGKPSPEARRRIGRLL